jgi:pyruvate,water dikinase
MRQGIAPASVSLAVVVQRLIPADTAGILFTANPTDGTREQAVINAAWGLGEAIVGGQVTPDTVVVDTSNWRILSRTTAAKTTMTVRIEQGTAEQPVPPTQQTQRVLDDETAIELARYGAQIEDHYGMPMDIEWAIVEGKIAILQARPITNLPPPPLRDLRWEPPQPGIVWMRRQVVEHMPEPLSPLFDELYLREGLTLAVDSFISVIGGQENFQMSLKDFLPQGFAITVNGYAYSVASVPLDWSLIPVILQFYGGLWR